MTPVIVMDATVIKLIVLCVALVAPCKGVVLRENGASLKRKYLQPNDVGKNPIYDSLRDDGRICTRDCTKSRSPRICYYQITVEQYHTMGPACDNCPPNEPECNKQCIRADGIERMVLTMNRMLPGVTINVCERDQVIVDVINKMPGRSVAFHWHGMLQRRTPWMDGVAFLTQCPIDEGQMFRYAFIAEQPGTHIYRSQIGQQFPDGLFAPLIVRPLNVANTHNMDPYLAAAAYDYDLPSHTVVINDWAHLPADSKYPSYHKYLSQVYPKIDNYLINGKGSFENAQGGNMRTSHATFHVQYGKKYRFRIIAATSFTCTFKFTIENHYMKVIAVDGISTQYRRVRSLVMIAGDRYDVIIWARQTPRSYYMLVQGEGACAGQHQKAYFVYEGKDPVPTYNYKLNSAFKYPLLNTIRNGCIMNAYHGETCLDRMLPYYPAPKEIIRGTPFKTIILSIGAQQQFSVESTHSRGRTQTFDGTGPTVFTDTLNKISCKLPPFPLLTQKDDIPKDLECPEYQCSEQICHCLHIYKIPLNRVVELVLKEDLSNDKVHFHQPMHLHGHRLYIMKQGTREDRQRPGFWKIPQATIEPLERDVVTVPAGGFAVVRFQATNPGFWMFNSQYNFHHQGGMFIVFQVGERSDFERVPVDFPQCRNYLPDIIFSSNP